MNIIAEIINYVNRNIIAMTPSEETKMKDFLDKLLIKEKRKNGYRAN